MVFMVTPHERAGQVDFSEIPLLRPLQAKIELSMELPESSIPQRVFFDVPGEQVGAQKRQVLI